MQQYRDSDAMALTLFKLVQVQVPSLSTPVTVTGPSNCHGTGPSTSNPASRTPSSCVGQMDTQPWTRILRPLGRHWQRLGEAETRRTVIGTGFIGSLQFVQFPYKIVESAISCEISHLIIFIIAASACPKINSLQGMSKA